MYQSAFLQRWLRTFLDLTLSTFGLSTELSVNLKKPELRARIEELEDTAFLQSRINSIQYLENGKLRSQDFFINLCKNADVSFGLVDFNQRNFPLAKTKGVNSWASYCTFLSFNKTNSLMI